MKYTVSFYNYNNYNNRILKRSDDIADYGTPLLTIENVEGFPLNDGISTRYTINLIPYNITDISPDYMLLINPGEPNITDDTIHSRWFVIESQYTRQGQFVCDLYRDTIAEQWETIKTAPCYVEKGWLPYNQFDPVTIQSENFSVSQVKQSSDKLYDETNTPWIVGYIGDDYFDQEEPQRTITIKAYTDTDYSFNTWGEFEYSDYTKKPDAVVDTSSKVAGNYINTDTRLRTPFRYYTYSQGTPGYTSRQFSSTLAVNTATEVAHSTTASNDFTISESGIGSVTYVIKQTYLSGLKSLANDYYYGETMRAFATSHIPEIGQVYSESIFGGLLKYNNKTVKVGDKYYKLRVEEQTAYKNVTINSSDSIYTTWYNALKTARDSLNDLFKPYTRLDESISDLSITIYYTTHKLIAEEYSSAVKTIVFPETAKSLTTTNYRLFAMPWDDLDIYSAGSKVLTQSGLNDKLIALNLPGAISSDYLKDLQILPYCPVRNLLNDGKIDIGLGTNESDYVAYTSTIEGVTTPEGYVFFASSDSDRFNIKYTKTISDYKLESNTDLYRLCSPNYASMFDFNAAKNEGINDFVVKFTYKPVSPSVIVHPTWAGIYGNYEGPEARGLICKGDFSLPFTTDAWTQWAVQNKYQQQIFDRGIENLEVQQEYQRVNQIFGAIGGSITGGAGGAVTGAKMGGGVGAAVGAVAGTALGVVGGIVDYNMSEKLRNEQMDYTKDMYNYSIATIKAKPDTLVNVGVLDINNTLVPTLEYYTCTNVERRALENKIKYNGITINVIDILDNYIDYNRDDYQYIKGKLIRIDGINEDYHYLATLTEEIYKGVFV